MLASAVQGWLTCEVGGFLDFILELFQHYGFSGFFSAALSGNTTSYFIIFAGIPCNALVTRGSCWKHLSCKIYSPKWTEPLPKSYVVTVVSTLKKLFLFLLPLYE